MQKKVLGRTAAALASRAWLASLASLMGRSIGAAFAFGNAPAAGRRSGDRRWTAVVRAPACAKPKRLRFGEGRSSRPPPGSDRESVVYGKGVDVRLGLGGRSTLQKKKDQTKK